MMATTCPLTRFLFSADDPRLVLLDIRPRDEHWVPLDNEFFPHVELPGGLSSTQLPAVAATLCGRHVVVVGKTEEAALRVTDELIARDVEAAALQGGIAGWFDALIERRVDEFGATLVAVIRRPALGIDSYVVANADHVLLVDPSGSIEATLAEARRFGKHIEAVVDTALHNGSASCAKELAVRCEALYYVPAQGVVRSELVDGIWLEPLPDGSLGLRARAFTISPAGYALAR